MNIEEKLRGALDTPAPPPTTTLDHVLKRGRRRVFAQRAGAVLGVFVVVAGIGIGATTLNQAGPDSTPAEQPDRGPATAERLPGWPRVDAPPQQPYDTWRPTPSASPSAGRPVEEIPLCNIRKPTQPVSFSTEAFSAEFVPELIDLVRRELPQMTIGNVPGNSILDVVQFDVTDSGGTGGIGISGGRFSGTPQWHADDALWSNGDCAPARRHTGADGSVMQLYGVRHGDAPQSLTQVLEVYRKDGLLVRVELRNYGGYYTRSDPNRAGYLETLRADRPTLPLTEEQFARLGPAIAGVA